MRPARPAVGRAAAAALACAVVGAGLLVAAAPARATVGDVDAAGPITRQLVVERALSWADDGVPYSQSDYFPASAPRSGVGHSYRQDCSGFVSMAWDLPSSAVTGDFVSSSSSIDTALASWDQLQPGDLLGVSGHTILFLGWSANDAGRHRYFDMVSEATSGTSASVQRSQDRQGYWSPYLPFRYDHVVEDAPASVALAGGRTDQLTVDAAGSLTDRSTTGSSWTTTPLTGSYGLSPLRPGLAVASSGGSAVHVLATTTDGRLVDIANTGSGWVQTVLASGSTVGGLAAAGAAGRIDLLARQHGGAGDDSPGTLVQGSLVGTSWSGWTAVPGAPGIVDDPAVARTSAGALEAVVETADGTLALGTGAGAGWSWSMPFAATRVSLRPAIAALPDGTLVVLAVGGGALQAATRPTGSGLWSGFATIPGVPSALSAPATSSVGFPPYGAPGSAIVAWMETAGGAVVAAHRMSDGSWKYDGTTPPPAAGTSDVKVGARTLNRS